jgi:hypothetical protein
MRLCNISLHRTSLSTDFVIYTGSQNQFPVNAEGQLYYVKLKLSYYTLKEI